MTLSLLRGLLGELLFYLGVFYGAFVALRAAQRGLAKEAACLWLVLLAVAAFSFSLYPVVGAVLPLIPEARYVALWLLVTANPDAWPGAYDTTVARISVCANPITVSRALDRVMLRGLTGSLRFASYAISQLSCVPSAQKVRLQSQLAAVEMEVGERSACQ